MAGNKSVTFSPREMEVLALSWQCMDAQPKIDVNKLALLTGYTPGSASVTFGKIKQKLKALGDSLSAAPPPPITPKKAGGGGKKGSTSKATPKSGSKRAASAAAETPSKRAKKGGSMPVEDESEGDFPDDVYVKKEKVEEAEDGSAGFYNDLRGGMYGREFGDEE